MNRLSKHEDFFVEGPLLFRVAAASVHEVTAEPSRMWLRSCGAAAPGLTEQLSAGSGDRQKERKSPCPQLHQPACSHCRDCGGGWAPTHTAWRIQEDQHTQTLLCFLVFSHMAPSPPILLSSSIIPPTVMPFPPEPGTSAGVPVSLQEDEEEGLCEQMTESHSFLHHR